MNHNGKSIKVKIFGIPVLLLLVLFVWIIAAGFSLTQTWLNQDKWQTFDSRREYKTAEHPRFKIDYPATWKSKAYHGYYRGKQDIWAILGGNNFYLTYAAFVTECLRSQLKPRPDGASWDARCSSGPWFMGSLSGNLAYCISD